MYGLTFTEALFVWAAVMGFLVICFVLVLCTYIGLTEPPNMEADVGSSDDAMGPRPRHVHGRGA